MRVRARGLNEEIKLAIVDDGVGFALDEARSKGRRGLAGMHERVELLRGDLQVRAAPGEGTTIAVTLPVRPSPEVAQR